MIRIPTDRKVLQTIYDRYAESLELTPQDDLESMQQALATIDREKGHRRSFVISSAARRAFRLQAVSPSAISRCGKWPGTSRGARLRARG
jgi:hypothetical protein